MFSDKLSSSYTQLLPLHNITLKVYVTLLALCISSYKIHTAFSLNFGQLSHCSD